HVAGRNLVGVEKFCSIRLPAAPAKTGVSDRPASAPGRSTRLILEIHGGPHAMYGVEFGYEFQVQAARGFVVLYTNPRGSTGYGEEFGNIIDARYPGDDFKDLMAGVDAVAARGYVDTKKLAVT